MNSYNNSKKSKNTEPWWKKRRIETDVIQLPRDVRVLEKKGEPRKREKYKIMERKYKIREKGLTVILEELKQGIVAKKAKVN